MKKIITLTMNPAIDTSSQTERIVPEHKLRCSLQKSEPGGGGINVSRVIKRFGGRSTAYYLAGGFSGRRLEDLLKQEKIGQIRIPVAGSLRENFIIYEKTSGRQYRFAMPGTRVNGYEWKKSIKMLSSIRPRPDYIVASGSLSAGIPEDFYAHLARKAEKLQVRLIVDTSGKALQFAAHSRVYLLKPNAREFQELAGKGIKEIKQQKEAASGIIAKSDIDCLVISLGSSGALLATKKGCEHIRAPIVKVKSKVGAGDSMLAGIAFSLTQGNPMEHAVRFGVAAGTAAVTTPGTELCKEKDTWELYKRFLTKETERKN